MKHKLDAVQYAEASIAAFRKMDRSLTEKQAVRAAMVSLEQHQQRNNSLYARALNYLRCEVYGPEVAEELRLAEDRAKRLLDKQETLLHTYFEEGCGDEEYKKEQDGVAADMRDTCARIEVLRFTHSNDI